MNPPNIPLDKRLHIAAGLLLALFGAFIAPWPAFALPVLGAVGKEVWDHYHPPHTVEVLDIVATLAGAVPVWVVLLLMK